MANSSLLAGQKRHYVLALIFSLIVFVVVIAPLIYTPFSGDDVFDSVWPEQRLIEGRSLLDDTIMWTSYFQNEFGKFNPISHFVAGAFSTLFDRRVYFKLGQIVAEIIVAGSFAYLASILLRSRWVAPIAILVLASLTYFRPYPGPYISFGVTIKWVTLISVWGLICAVQWMKNPSRLRRRYWGNGWLFTTTIYIFSYELVVAHLLASAFLAGLCRRRRERNSALVVVSVLSFLYMLSRGYLLLNRTGSYAAYQFGNSLPMAISGAAKQVFSTLPLAHYAYVNTLENIPQGLYILIGCVVAVLAALSFFAVRISLPNLKGIRFRNVLICVALGAIYILVPSLFSGLSSGLQALPLGVGYLFLMPQVIGLALAAIGFIAWIAGRQAFAPPGKLVQASIVIATASSFISNVSVIFALDTRVNVRTLGYPREIDERFILEGMKNVPAQYVDKLWALPPRPWLTNSNIQIRAKNHATVLNQWWRFSKRPPIVPSECVLSNNPDECRISEPVVVNLTRALDYRQAYTLLAKSDRFRFSPYSFELASEVKESNRPRFPSEDDFKSDAYAYKAFVFFVDQKQLSCQEGRISTSSGDELSVRLHKQNIYVVENQEGFWMGEIQLRTFKCLSKISE